MNSKTCFKKLVTSSLVTFLMAIGFFVMAQENEMTITGIVNAWEWDENDNITVVSISTEDEDIIVGENDLGKELLDLVDHEVKVTGIVSKNENDDKVIMVSEYEDFGLAEIEEESDESEPEPESN